MARGTINRIVTGKGFGFIRAAGVVSEDVFFHARDLIDGLTFSDQLVELEVEYNPMSGPKGIAAKQVRAIHTPAPRGVYGQ